METPTGWQKVPLGDLVTRLTNGTTFQQTLQSTGIPVTRIETISNEVVDLERVRYANGVDDATIAKYRLLPGDLLFSNINSGMGVGRTAVFKGHSSIVLHGMNLLLLRPSERIDSMFLFYQLKYLRHKGYFLSIAQHAVNQASINQTKLRAVEIGIPVLPEQRRIVSAIETQLGRLDAAVSRLHAAKAKLQRYKQAVLNEMVHPQENVESHLLGDVVEKVQVGPFGSQLHKADYVSGGVPLINPQHISEQVITPDMDLTVSAKKFRELPNYHLRKGDVIVGRRGEMGRCAVITEKEDGWFCGTGSLYIRPSKALDPRYLAGFLASPTSVAYLQGASIGTTMSNLNKGILLDMPIELPPLSEQRRLVARIEHATAGANEMEATLDAQLLQSTRLRQAVLKRAFEGRLG